MMPLFSLKYKGDHNVSPVEIIEANVHQLELLCKKAIQEDFLITLYSPEEYTECENIYELSAMLAEDLVLKYNENNKIVRVLN